ncbi:MAG: hypothetical protein SFU91_12370 [Chloroherpetonaceae bacterium]|nr:hypothetical protein [Chloroherpetonaceae bacterium]
MNTSENFIPITRILLALTYQGSVISFDFTDTLQNAFYRKEALLHTTPSGSSSSGHFKEFINFELPKATHKNFSVLNLSLSHITATVYFDAETSGNNNIVFDDLTISSLTHKNEEGESLLSVELSRVIDGDGTPIAGDIVWIRREIVNGQTTTFEDIKLKAVELNDGIEFDQSPFESLSRTRYRRVRGFRRTFRIKFAPLEGSKRLGLGRSLEAALLQQTILVKAWNIFAESETIDYNYLTPGSSGFRRLLIENDDIEKESVIEKLVTGKGFTLSFVDASIQTSSLSSYNAPTLIYSNPTVTLTTNLEGVECRFFVLDDLVWKRFTTPLGYVAKTESNGAYSFSSPLGTSITKLKAVTALGTDVKEVTINV